MKSLIAKCLKVIKLSFPGKTLLIVLVTNNSLKCNFIMSEVRLYKHSCLEDKNTLLKSE